MKKKMKQILFTTTAKAALVMFESQHTNTQSE